MAQLAVAAVGAMVGSATLGTGVVALGMTGAGIGWMVGSIVGSMLFAPDAPDGPRIADKKVQSSIYGQPIPIIYGTERVGAQVLWASDLIEHSEEVGGKGGGGVTVYSYSVNMLVSVCEGPATPLRIWGNGRLIWTNDATSTGDVDESLIQRGNVRWYTGTEDQLPDPVYEAAVGTANAVAYRGQVVIMLEGLQLEFSGNRPPSIEVEVAQSTKAVTCRIDPFHPTDVADAGLYQGPNGVRSHSSNAAAFDRSTNTYYVVTGTTTRQVEAYSVSGTAPALAAVTALPKWPVTSGGTNFTVAGVAFDPENALLRIAAGFGAATVIDAPIEYILSADVAEESAARFYTTWGDFPTTGQNGGNGGYNGIVYSIYPSSGAAPLGEAGWWTHSSAMINYRLPRLVNGDQGGATMRGWHLQDLGSGRTNEIADVVYIPKGSGVIGGINIGWKWWSWKGYLDNEGSISVIAGADGSDTTMRRTYLIYAPNRRKLYIVTAGDGVAVMDLSTATGDASTLSRALTAYPAAVNAAVDFAVWNERADGLVLGHHYAGQTTVWLLDPDDMTVLVGPCSYLDTQPIQAPKDIGDGRFVCVYGSSQVAIVDSPGGGVVQGEPVMLSAIVSDLCVRSGLTTGQLDVTELTDMVAGFKVARQTSARQAIDSLRPAYFFDGVESAQKLVWRKRGGPPVATLTEGELGARVWQAIADGPEPAREIEYVDEMEASRELSVSYIDAAANYDPGVQTARRQVGEANASASLEVPVVLTADEAMKIALGNLLHAHASKDPIKIKLTHAYGALEPADPIIVPLADGTQQRIRIESLVRARPLLEVEAVMEDGSIYSRVWGGVDRSQGPRQTAPSALTDTTLVLLDLPPLRDQDDDLIIYVAMAGAVRDMTWPGAVLYRSTDGGSSYYVVLSTPAAATIGIAVSALGDWTGGNRWDEHSAVDVLLSSGTFSSGTDLAVLNGANAVAIGEEIVQFRTAELVGENTWRLSRLLRGRKGTERAIAGHASGDRVVLLAESSLRKVELSFGDIGSARHYKGVTSGQAVSDASAVALTLAGRSLMPLAPVGIAGERDISDDLTITWVRRARVNADWNDYVDVPLDESSESYQIDIIDGASVVRTLTASTPSVIYTAAQQTTDFGSPQASVAVRIYQISSRVGRGHAGEATV